MDSLAVYPPAATILTRTKQGETVEDKEVCKCGKASVEFIIVGEDRWTAKLDNATAKRGKGEVQYICKSCGEVFANADSAMMTVGCI